MESLKHLDALIVNQKKELGEIITGFETRNKYKILDNQGQELFSALEEGGSTLARLFLKNLRSFEMCIRNSNGDLQIKAKRPFRFYFHEIDVYDGNDNLLGTIKREFTLIRREYSVLDPKGNKIFSLFGPVLKPWTFQILDNGQEVGKITKKWSGLLKESFSDADNFGVTFPISWETNTKALFLGAVFLIDFVHFENTN